MDTNITQTFTSEQFGSVRTTVIDGVIYFVAADVCKALDIGNTSMAMSRLGDDEKMTISNTEGHSGQRGGAQMFNLVNEPGLYRLVFMSRKPNAKDFQRWIFHNVIPDIRKFGFYATPAAVDKIIGDPDSFIRLLSEIKNQRDTINQQALTIKAQCDSINYQKNFIERQGERIDALKVKAEQFDDLVNSDSLFTANQIAKELGMTVIRLNRTLHAKFIQYKQGDCWFLYKEYADLGWVKYVDYPYINARTGEKCVNHQMRWTFKGRLAILDILKNELNAPPPAKPAQTANTSRAAVRVNNDIELDTDFRHFF